MRAGNSSSAPPPSKYAAAIPDDFCVNLELTLPSNLRPDGLVVDHDAVVEHADAIPHHRLVVGQAISDKAAVPYDHMTGIRQDLLQQPCDRIVRAEDVVALALEIQQTTGVLATLLRMLDQNMQVIHLHCQVRNDPKNSAHYFSSSLVFCTINSDVG